LPKNVYQLSTDSGAIFGDVIAQRVTIQGYVMSVDSAAVELRGAGGSGTIGATGLVSNANADIQAAVRLFGSNGRVNNAGEISGDRGVALFADDTIVNSGTISGTGTACNAEPNASAGVTLSAFGPSDMRISNTGLIDGAVQVFSSLYIGQRFAIWENRDEVSTITIDNAGTILVRCGWARARMIWAMAARLRRMWISGRTRTGLKTRGRC
jgi:hypothetical protein